MIEVTQRYEGDRLLSASITTDDWKVDVFLARGYTGNYYATNQQTGENRIESVGCGNLDLAVERAVQFVYQNVWENL